MILRLIFGVVLGLSIFLKLGMTELASQCLAAFFAITFGFNMTYLAVMFGSVSNNKYYSQEDPNIPGQRIFHTIRNYCLIFGRLSLIPILMIMTYTSVATTNEAGQITIQAFHEYVNYAINGIILGIASVNVVMLWIMLDTATECFVHDAQNFKTKMNLKRKEAYQRSKSKSD